MRRFIASAFVAALGVSLVGCGGSSPGGGGDNSSGGTIKIGSIHPLSGPLADDGQQMDKAVKLAIEEINAAGGIKSIGGAKLEMVSGDSQGKPEVGQSEAQRIVQAGAAAIVGAYQSAVTANVSTVAERSQVPLVIDVATANELLQKGYKYTFRTQPNATKQGEFGARYLKQMADDAGIKLDKVAYLREQTEFGASVYRAFATEAQKQGFTVDPVLTYDSQQVTDLTPQITQIKAAGAKVLATTGYFRDGVLLAKAVASVRPDLDAVWGVASGAFDLPTFPTAAAGAGEGYFNSNYFFNSANPETVELRKQFQAKYNEEMRSGSILAYEAVRVVAKGLENGKSKDPKKLRDSISKVKIDNPYMATAGPIEFDETGENKNAAPVVVQVQQGKVAKIWPKDGADAKYRFPAK